MPVRWARMHPDGPRIDEACRRRFEVHRLAGGQDALELFLPPEGAPARDDTLEELVLIELEFLWKAWGGEGDPPSLDAVVGRHPSLCADAVRRIRAEAVRLRGRSAHRSPAAAGTRIGHCTLIERAGRGASADVWRARDEELQRDVAIKLAREELVGEETLMARLVREARSTAQLRHPAIVTVHEVGTRGGQPFIVSDFIEGPTLAQEIARRSFTPGEAATVAARLADALDYAHACGVVHRDVKPGNVLLTADGRPVLADFGLAQLARAETGLTRQGDVLGTPAYMAPEQARGDVDQVDARSDVYALGAVLYELLTGSPPFTGVSAASVLYAVIHRDPAPPGVVRPGVPADLATVCGRAMARDRADRYASAREFADDLRRFLAREPVAARPPGPWRRIVLWTHRNPALAATLAVSAALVLAVAGAAFARVVQERDRVRANLYRALVGEADARLAALDTEWYGRTRAALKQAAALDVADRDVVALRELAARCEGTAKPSFERLAEFAPHGGAVRRLAAVPGGDLIAGLGAPDEVWLRSAHDGSLVATRQFAGEVLRALAADPDGAALLVAGDTGHARVLALPDLRETGSFDVGRSVWCCALGSELAVVGVADGSVRFLQRQEGRLTQAATLAAHEGGVLTLALSPDGAHLATAGEDRRIAEWDVATLAPADEHELSDSARSLRYSDDGRQLVWASTEDLGFGVRAHRGAFELRAGLHDAGVRDVLGAGPGRFVTASADGTLRAWSTAFDPLAVAEGGAGPIVAAAALDADGRVVVAHSGGRLRVWRLAESGARRFFAAPHVAVFAPGGSRLFTGREFVDFESRGDELRTLRTARVPSESVHALRAWGAALSPDGRIAASSGHAGAVRLVDPSTGDLVATLLARGDPAWTVAFAPDAATLAAGSGDDVLLFDVATRAERVRITGHERLVTGAAFHPTEPLIATVSLDRTLRLWDPRDGTPLGAPVKLRSALHGLCFSPDGSRLAVAADDGGVLVWDARASLRAAAREPDAAAHAPMRRLTGHESAAWAASYSPDGRLFASCDDRGRTVLRDGTTLRPIVTLRADVRRGRSVSFSDDGRLLAVGCFSGLSVVWDLVVLRRRLAELGLDW